MALAVVWMGSLLWLNSVLGWWLLPVAGSLIFSVPLSVYSSRVSWGLRFRKWGLLVIPEEIIRVDTLEYMRDAIGRRMAPGHHNSFMRVA